MLSPVDQYFQEKQEPLKNCLMFLRQYILDFKGVTEDWKYGMPFYFYKGKRFCYLWVHKKSEQPYIGFVNGKLLEHPALIAEKRSRMKILLLDPQKDLPMEIIDELLVRAIVLSG